MSRIESGRMVLEETWINLREIIKEIEDLMKPEIMAHNHDCEFIVADELPEYVLCDKLRMTQLLLNLMSNAVKYTPKQGRIKLEVKEGFGAPTGYTTLEFVISDTGIGISKEFQKRLFEPFERENNSTVSKVMGSGLGMPICKGIVDSMGGSMTVDSVQGRGTVITVLLAMRCRDCDTRFNPGFLLQVYIERPRRMNRTYVHILLHCLFRHMFSARDREDPELWDLCCDIAAESVVDSMSYDVIARSHSTFREGWYEKLEGEL